MHRAIISCVILAVLSGCTTIQLVSKYDETTDKEASAIQKKLSEFFVKQQAASTDSERSFARSQPFFQDVTASLNALQVRAGGIYKNSLTVEQLHLAEDNLAYLALLHKSCITGNLSDIQRKAVRAQGVDTSLDCRVQYGASADLTGRGGQTLNAALIPPVSAIFDQTFGAVIALELAKKRGEGDKK
ncbi:hypothetical protein ASE06_05895 [Sphingopyxis sp. Root214]|jgi:hypothetical protein|uniref:hypothetical protein n=1 Tax=unclassified Sphingopyxis TaxID=2614943 RepID=UPI0006FB6769|nr:MULTISPECIES: hypothetical protein [unclassified Sphingopyxis]KQZ76719.1 hypothetical protein ASD73_02100 [Sphingopyxis sp. Root154]KRC09394.1 hypothetical protein ASE06_05895 [Sphingopyxis sp. Root214]